MHLAAAAAALTLACSGTANASITIGSITPGTNPYSGPAPTYDFNTVATTPPLAGGAVVTGTAGGHAQPYGSAGSYYSVGTSDTQPGTIDLSSFGNINTLSFLWGSVDSYNVLDFLAADGTTVLAHFTGNDIFDPASGNQTDPNTNPVVTFLLNGGSESSFTYLRLTTNPSANAFEIDNLAVNPAVPEPATWAMMLLGFGGIGIAMRRRRTTALAQLA
jgi:PEP-CTERM motif